MNMKTWTPRAAEIERNWYVVDAEGQTLGRLATKIATALLGKAKPTYADHMDTGDFVIVINAAKLVVTGDRLLSKRYHSHSGHPGGHREEGLGDREQVGAGLAVPGSAFSRFAFFGVDPGRVDLGGESVRHGQGLAPTSGPVPSWPSRGPRG